MCLQRLRLELWPTPVPAKFCNPARQHRYRLRLAAPQRSDL